jgi:hypothetical protein
MGSGPSGNGFQFGANNALIIPKYSGIGNGEYAAKAISLGLPPNQLYPEPGIIVIFSTDITDVSVNPVQFVPDTGVSATLQQATNPTTGNKLPIYYISGINYVDVSGKLTITNPKYTNIFIIGSGGNGSNSGSAGGGGGSGGTAIYANSTMDPSILDGVVSTGNYKINIGFITSTSVKFTGYLSENFDSKPYKAKMISSNKTSNLISSFKTKYAPAYESYDILLSKL